MRKEIIIGLFLGLLLSAGYILYFDSQDMIELNNGKRIPSSVLEDGVRLFGNEPFIICDLKEDWCMGTQIVNG